MICQSKNYEMGMKISQAICLSSAKAAQAEMAMGWDVMVIRGLSSKNNKEPTSKGMAIPIQPSP